MAELTKIEWADHTWNPWEGCQKVGPGCDWCYAWARNARFGGGTAPNWGPGAPRRLTGKANWLKPEKWNRDAEAFERIHGRRQRVFCASLADLFDNAVDLNWAHVAMYQMRACSNLNWLPLTKRIGNVASRVPEEFLFEWPHHIGLMITVVNQEEADRDIPKLLTLKARFGIPWVGISYEPALGPIDLRRWIGEAFCGSTYVGMGEEFERCALTGAPCDGLDWLIAGAESGPNARPAHPDWFRAVRDQCAAAGVAFLFKQWGEWIPWEPGQMPCWDSQHGLSEDRHGLFPSDFDHDPKWDDGLWGIAEGLSHAAFQRVGKKQSGRLLDGIEHNGFPEVLR